MAGYTGKTTNLQREVVGTQTQGEREDVMGEIPGKIISFDPATQTATIQPLYEPKHNGKPVKMPELLEVPVRFARAGGGFATTYPVKAGDNVMLRPQMRSSEKYHTEGTYQATDTRSMNLSDMEAFLDGGEPLTDPIQNFDPANFHMRFTSTGEFGIKGSPDGKFQMKGAQGDVYKLICEAVDLAQQTAYFLADEPTLTHVAEYASIAGDLEAVFMKLGNMWIGP